MHLDFIFDNQKYTVVESSSSEDKIEKFYRVYYGAICIADKPRLSEYYQRDIKTAVQVVKGLLAELRKVCPHIFWWELMGEEVIWNNQHFATDNIKDCKYLADTINRSRRIFCSVPGTELYVFGKYLLGHGADEAEDIMFFDCNGIGCFTYNKYTNNTKE